MGDGDDDCVLILDTEDFHVYYYLFRDSPDTYLMTSNLYMISLLLAMLSIAFEK